MPNEQNINPKKTGGLKTILLVLGLFTLTLGATAVEFLFKAHDDKPALGNVVALALLNINVLLLVILLLLLGRQFVKFYFERKRSPFGAGFRSRLVAAFVGLSIIPAGVLFFVAIGLLSGGVKYWFGPKVENTMRSSIALVEGYKEEVERDALSHAVYISRSMRDTGLGGPNLAGLARASLYDYGLDLVEVYDAKGTRLARASRSEGDWPRVNPNLVKKAATDASASETKITASGGMSIAASSVVGGGGAVRGVVVVGKALSPEMLADLSDISAFYREYWDLRSFKNPLKESYVVSFVLVSLVIVFAAMWFGLYLSRDITAPINALAEATQRISSGDYDFPVDVVAKDEIGALVGSFKKMTRDLKSSQARLSEANISLVESNTLLERRRRFIETVLENVNAGVITVDRAGRISTMNGAAQRILGLESDHAVGRGYRELFEFHQLDEIREQVGVMTGPDHAPVEKEIQITINRRSLNLRLYISALRDPDGTYLGILVVFDDLTELIKAQRASAWKEVARRIAHEVKNPLTPIQLSAQRLRKRFLEGGAESCEKIIGECTETIITQVESMKTLVDEFSKFARMPEARLEPGELGPLLDEVAALYSGAYPDVTFVREYDPALPVVMVDKEQIRRVFINLFDNAVAALDGKGRVWVSAALDAETGVARVEVADEGAGILPEDREKLFQPYFSKKKSGAGLGLAIVNRIISDHGGYIRVQGNEPKGARFIIELPVKG